MSDSVADTAAVGGSGTTTTTQLSEAVKPLVSTHERKTSSDVVSYEPSTLLDSQYDEIVPTLDTCGAELTVWARRLANIFNKEFKSHEKDTLPNNVTFPPGVSLNTFLFKPKGIPDSEPEVQFVKQMKGNKDVGVLTLFYAIQDAAYKEESKWRDRELDVERSTGKRLTPRDINDPWRCCEYASLRVKYDVKLSDMFYEDPLSSDLPGPSDVPSETKAEPQASAVTYLQAIKARFATAPATDQPTLHSVLRHKELVTEDNRGDYGISNLVDHVTDTKLMALDTSGKNYMISLYKEGAPLIHKGKKKHELFALTPDVSIMSRGEALNLRSGTLDRTNAPQFVVTVINLQCSTSKHGTKVATEARMWQYLTAILNVQTDRSDTIGFFVHDLTLYAMKVYRYKRTCVEISEGVPLHSYDAARLLCFAVTNPKQLGWSPKPLIPGVATIKKCLGNGTSGVVFAGVASSGDEVAAKLFIEDGIDLHEEDTVLKDIAASCGACHARHFPRVQSSTIETDYYEGDIFFQGQYRQFGGVLVMQPVGVCAKKADRSLRLAVLQKTPFRSFVAALQMVHSRHIVHRDVKPSNLIVVGHDVTHDVSHTVTPGITPHLVLIDWSSYAKISDLTAVKTECWFQGTACYCSRSAFEVFKKPFETKYELSYKEDLIALVHTVLCLASNEVEKHDEMVYQAAVKDGLDSDEYEVLWVEKRQEYYAKHMPEPLRNLVKRIEDFEVEKHPDPPVGGEPSGLHEEVASQLLAWLSETV